MSLRERLGRTDQERVRKQLFQQYGIWNNPFPASEQTAGHPRKEDRADEQIVDRVRRFEDDAHPSQALVIEGTQGVGKTNLLNYYEQEFTDLYRDQRDMYIIRYHPDLEPSFDAVLRTVVEALDQDLFARIGQALHNHSAADDVIEVATSHEVRLMLHSLRREASGGDIQECAQFAREWCLGLRVLKTHRMRLHVHFRLHTVESRTRALRDVVYVTARLGLLKGIILLLDELEKQDISQRKTAVLRFLLAIRALIDAFPNYLFLMLAMTVEAKQRYFAMLPAMASRLQTTILLSPLSEAREARELCRFYVDVEREETARRAETESMNAGTEALIGDGEVNRLFDELRRRADTLGQSGVTQRELLNHLHQYVENVIRAAANSG